MAVDNRARLAFAFSGAAQGLISNGILYFLLIYYSQVLGLDASLAGLALMIAMIFDAVSDPLIGRWSDRLQHRLGRRHPFLYISIVPVTISYYLLWDVPELSQTGLFFYLLVMIITLRVCLTAHVVPFSALTPELAPDYDERTALMSSSNSSYWFISTIMGTAMYAYWLADNADYPDGAGVLRQEGYIESGFVTAIVVFFALSAATHLTRKYIPELSGPPDQSGSVAEGIKQAGATIKDKNFLVIGLYGVFFGCAMGTATALWVYIQPYFWGFDSEQISIMLLGQLLSALIAYAVLPTIMRGRDKKPVLISISILALLINCLPVFLSLFNLFPANGTTALFYTMFVLGIAQVTVIVITASLSGSILADVVDARAVDTGRREEGLLFSVQSFISKVASGIGVSIAGMVLTLISFPSDSLSTALIPETVSNLGWAYAGTLGFFFVLSIITLLFYSADRATHEQNISILDSLP